MSEIERLKGGRELARALHELPERIARNDLQAAVSAGAAVIRDEARTRAPVYAGRVPDGHPAAGTLRRNIVSKAIGELSSMQRRVMFVLVRHGKSMQSFGKKMVNRDAFYWRFVEFGTRKMRPRPFMRPAFEARKRDAVAAITDKLAERIEKHKNDLSW